MRVTVGTSRALVRGLRGSPARVTVDVTTAGAAVQGWNSLLLGAVSMGEGWHNNHHTFPRSARLLGSDGGSWILGWWLIAGLRALGLAKEILLPGEETRVAAAVARSTVNGRWAGAWTVDDERMR